MIERTKSATGTSRESSTSNEEVAAAFAEMAELLSIEGDNPFRVRAYEHAAQSIRALPHPLSAMGGTADWQRVPGIGTDLAAKIGELLRTGRLRSLLRLRQRVPQGLLALLALPGLGPARVRVLHRDLGVRGIADLKRAVRNGTLDATKGLGPALGRRLSREFADNKAHPKRWLWSTAHDCAESLCVVLRAVEGVLSVDVAGSLRRGRDTVGDIDIVVCAGRRIDLRLCLAGSILVTKTIVSGPTRCTVLTTAGLQVDVRLVSPASRGAALYYLTGSRAHNLRLRQRAIDHGLKLNEYGLYRNRRRMAGNDEMGILAALGLSWIPPELREDRGEIGAAENATLPRLVEFGDLKGDLHVHTLDSDGQAVLTDMVKSARALGLSYIAVTDHAKYLGVTHGLDARRLDRQIDLIDELNQSLAGFTILKGTEVDILEDGRLALSTAMLRKLDVVTVAIHSHFDLPRNRQTARILRALEHPCTTILAHPTGRLLNQRPSFKANVDAILAAARTRNCFVEINSQPDRLDLDDVLSRAARDVGLLLSIASDAHSAAEFNNLHSGIRQARRGWLSAADVLNTRPPSALRRLLAHSRR